MSLSDYTIRLMLIFFPGIVAFIIVDNLTSHKKTQIHHWIIYSFLLGFMSYILWMMLCGFMHRVLNINIHAQFLLSLVNSKAPIDFCEIRNVSFIAAIEGLFLVKARHGRWLFRLAKRLNISNKFPDVDAWENCLILYRPSWIRVRDYANDRCYQGRLISSSDENDRDGIVLEDVSVYTEVGDFLYSVPVVYIPRKMENLIIELL